MKLWPSNSPSYPPPCPEIEIQSRKPQFGYARVKFCFRPSIQFSTVQRLIRDLPPGEQLCFYYQGFPSSGDPGAYFLIERQDGGYIMACGNHGWTSEWRSIDPDTLARYLWGCRSHNMQGPWDGLSVTRWSERNRQIDNGPGTFFAAKFAERLSALEVT